MDVTQMTYKDNTFDVVIDKGNHHLALPILS